MGDMIYILVDCEVELPDFKISLQPLCKGQTSESNGIFLAHINFTI